MVGSPNFVAILLVALPVNLFELRGSRISIPSAIIYLTTWSPNSVLLAEIVLKYQGYTSATLWSVLDNQHADPSTMLLGLGRTSTVTNSPLSYHKSDMQQNTYNYTTNLTFSSSI